MENTRQAMVHFVDLPAVGRVPLVEDETVIGRGMDAHIQVEDRKVGRRHAAIVRKPDGRYTLKDLSSHNGTFVLGVRITEHELKAGDEIWLGGSSAVRFTFLEIDPNPAVSSSGPGLAPPPLAEEDSGTPKTMLFNANQTLNLAADAGESSENDLTKTAFLGTTSVRRRHIQFLVEDFVVKNYELVPGKPITIGRDRQENEIQLDHRSVSVTHAKIYLLNNMLPIVEDLGSTNGTKVNGESIEANTPVQLREGDQISFGVYTSRKIIFRDSAREEIEVESAEMSDGRMRIGREPDNELRLDHVLVSRHHAEIEESDLGYRLRDLGSQNGTFLNSKRLPPNEWTPVEDGDRIQIGAFIMNFTQGEVKAGRDSQAIRIDCRGLGRTVDTPMGPLAIMQGVTLTLDRRDLVGIIGPSGAGKSTFLNAISGLSPFDSGEVRYNGLDFLENREAIKPFIGFVPQYDKLHEGLTVRECLSFAAEMRLPKDTTGLDRATRVERVVESVDLTERIDTRISELSGGQKKRVSIATELLAQPGVLFLDEPTAGLDPRTTERMMHLFRRIASGGMTVVITTHLLGSFELFDKVIVLDRGRLAYCGPGTQFFGYFDVNSPAEVYAQLENEGTPEEWEQRFRGTEYFVDPEEASLEDTAERHTQRLPPAPEIRGPVGQFGVLLRRTLATKVADKGGFLTLMMQAPIVAGLVLALAGGSPNTTRTLFLIAISALWFGCANSVREVVDEGAIYKRERLSVLSIFPYMLSKLLVLSGLGLVQSILFNAVLTVGGALSGHFVEATLVMGLLYLNGVAIGLAVSAVSRTSTTALGAIPLVMIPQILFAGLLVPTGDVATLVPATSQEIIQSGRVEGAKLKQIQEQVGQTLGSGVATFEVGAEGKAELGKFAPVAHTSKAVQILSTLMASRWGMEALASVYVHDPFELEVEDSSRLYPYPLSNSIYLSLYSDAQRQALHDRLINGEGEDTSRPSGVFGRYLMVLLLFGFLSSSTVLLALRRRDGYEFR